MLVLVAATALFALLRPLTNLGGRYGRATSRQSLGYAGGINEAVRIAEEAHVFGAGAAQRAVSDGLVAPLSGVVLQTNLLARLVPGIYQSLIYLLVVAALGVSTSSAVVRWPHSQPSFCYSSERACTVSKRRPLTRCCGRRFLTSIGSMKPSAIRG